MPMLAQLVLELFDLEVDIAHACENLDAPTPPKPDCLQDFLGRVRHKERVGRMFTSY